MVLKIETKDFLQKLQLVLIKLSKLVSKVEQLYLLC